MSTALVGPDAYEPNPAEVQAIIERRLTRGKPGPTPRSEQVAITRRLFDQVITGAWSLSLRNQDITAAAVHAELPKPRGKSQRPFTVAQVQAVLESEMGRRALEDRGLALHEEQELTYEMVATIRALLDPRPLSHDQRLRVAGVTASQYQGFLTYPKFRQVLQEGTEVALKGGIAQANQKLVQQVEKGDLKAIQYLHTLTGYYDPSKQTALDAGQLMQDMMTIMFKRVKDPETLMGIAADMELLRRRLELAVDLNEQALPAGAQADWDSQAQAQSSRELIESLGGVPDWSPPAEAIAGLDDEESEQSTE